MQKLSILEKFGIYNEDHIASLSQKAIIMNRLRDCRDKNNVSSVLFGETREIFSSFQVTHGFVDERLDTMISSDMIAIFYNLTRYYGRSLSDFSQLDLGQISIRVWPDEKMKIIAVSSELMDFFKINYILLYLRNGYRLLWDPLVSDNVLEIVFADIFDHIANPEHYCGIFSVKEVFSQIKFLLLRRMVLDEDALLFFDQPNLLAIVAPHEERYLTLRENTKKIYEQKTKQSR